MPAFETATGILRLIVIAKSVNQLKFVRLLRMCVFFLHIEPSRVALSVSGVDNYLHWFRKWRVARLEQMLDIRTGELLLGNNTAGSLITR